jgi:hypothetical protein
MNSPVKELSIPKTFGIRYETDPNFDKTTLSQFNNYHQLYTSGVNQRISVYCWLATIWTSITILSYIPLPIISNCAVLVIGCYYVLYNNIYSLIGNKMACYLIFNYILSNIVSTIYSGHFYTACVIFLVSILCNIGSYLKFETGGISKLTSLEETTIYIVPLYSVTYIETVYNIKEYITIMVKFICNYIKKFSTSDVIKDESKDMGVDHGDQSGDLTGSVDEMDTVDETGVVDEALTVDDNSESVKQLDNIRKNISDAKTKIEEKRAEKAIVENVKKTL